MSDILGGLKALCRDDHCLSLDDLPDGDFVEVADGDWTQDCKYQHSETVVQHVPTGRYFEIHNSRSGSYHTDWYYSTAEVFEVERVEKVVTTVTWVEIKQAVPA